MNNSHTNTMRRSRWVRYTVAVAAPGIALVIRLPLSGVLGLTVPYITFFPAIMFSAWFGGAGPGMVSTVLSALLANYFLVPPIHFMAVKSRTEGLGLLLFVSVSTIISWLNEALHRARKRAEESAVLASERLRQFQEQQATAAVTLASIGDGVIATDVEGRVSFMNSIAEQLTGWSSAEARDRNIGSVFQIFRENTDDRVENPIDRVLRDGRVVGLANHTVLLNRSGSRIPIDDSGAPIKDTKGALIGAVLVFRDITERRKAEERRRAAEEKLDSILQGIEEGFALLGRDWRYTYANQEAARFARRKPEEMLGANIWDLFPDAVGSTLHQKLRQSMREQVHTHDEGYSSQFNLWYEVDCYPTPDGLCLFTRDITQRKQWEEALKDSQARINLALEAGGMGAWDWWIKTGKVVWSPQTMSMHGLQPEEFGGALEDFYRDIHPEDREAVRAAVERAVTERADVKTEYRIVLPDGRMLWLETRGALVLDEDGTPLRMTGISADITGRKQAEEITLRLAAIVESSEDAIISKDLNGIVTSWNKGAERIFGYSAEEMIGRPVAILAAPERRDEIPGILERIRKGERIEHYETVRRTKAGHSIHISLSVSPIRNSAGAIIGASKIARNISERVTSEQLLMRQAERLARSNADLQQFAYVTSHDLQEPLRTIVSFTQLLSQRYQTAFDHDANQFMSYIVTAATRMTHLISDLLGYSRVVNADEIPFADVPLRDAVEWAINNLQLAIEESKAAITLGKLPVVRGDKIQMVQLFQNLIGNAIKYRVEAAPRIDISAERQGTEWVISVQDNGMGIRPEYKERIFGVFKRLHGNDYPGTGIGLAICKSIVERHGGRIWVESNPGEGSTFKFTAGAASS